MSIDKKFLNLFTKVTEKAAIGASKYIGKKDKIAADKGAVDPMRENLIKLIWKAPLLLAKEKWMKRLCFILVKNLAL